MTKPIIPNWTPGVGQLATKRIEFEQHITGAAFRHTADQIDIGTGGVPTPITINGTTVYTVQEALITINSNLDPTIPSATVGTSASNLGLITLGGDLAGPNSTALSPKIASLQGYKITISTTPSSGQYLAWNTSSNAWIPTTPASTTVNLYGDVTGTANATVIKTISYSGGCVLSTNFNVGNGGVITVTGSGQIKVEVAAGLTINAAGGLVLEAAEDFVQYGTPHTRTIWNTFTVLNQTISSFDGYWSLANASTTAWTSNSVTTSVPFNFKLDDLHNGATITSLTICINTSHPIPPSVYPAVTIYRVHLGALNVTPSPIGVGLATSANYTPSSSITVFSASLSTVIDTANYVYFAEIHDESGGTAAVGNIYYGYSVTYGSITTDQFP
jgi:hypothetical protein